MGKTWYMQDKKSGADGWAGWISESYRWLFSSIERIFVFISYMQ